MGLPHVTGELPMTTDQMLEEIREANLTYLMLAQNMIRADKAEALYRLGISEQVADILENLSAGQILKIANSNMLMCRFRFDDSMVWNLLTSHTKDRQVAGIHAAILMSGKAAEASCAQ
jgi:flagellar transcriptional activator FlhD